MTFEHCEETVTHSNVLVEEHGMRANFRNVDRSPFRRVRIDNCVITEGPRADWIVSKIGTGSVVVELKGKDVEWACNQLFTTLSHPDCQIFLEDRRALLIVCSRNPLHDSKSAKLQEHARRKGVRLKIVCKSSDCAIETLLPA